MKDEKETRQRLLASAREEFMEKGYMKASLRNICKHAELTTGALYFFFQDKKDLFSSLVEEPVSKLYQVMAAHYREELEMEIASLPEHIDGTRDLEAALQILHYMYQYQEEFQLVLTRSQGSGYEFCIDSFVEITEQHYRLLADRLCRQWNLPLLDDYTIHWMAHMHIDTFVHMLTHEKSEEAARQHMTKAVKYFISGFYGMFKP